MEKMYLSIVSLEILPVKRRLEISRGEEKARPQFIHWLKPVVFLGIFYKHNATIGCPITTGIFAWVAAHAAEENAAEGKRDITPYWRTLKSGGVINEKYPGGIENIKVRLESEGHSIVQKGKKYVVQDYESSVVTV